MVQSEQHKMRSQLTAQFMPFFRLIARILTFDNQPMDQWTNGQMFQWTNGPMDQWYNGPIGHWSNQPIIQWSNGPMDRTLTLCSIAISRLDGIGMGYITSTGIGFFFRWTFGHSLF